MSPLYPIRSGRALFALFLTLSLAFPVSADSVDTDGDGLSDADETTLGSDPTLADTDGDAYADGYEVSQGTDPLVAELPDLVTTSIDFDASDLSVDVTVQNSGTRYMESNERPNVRIHGSFSPTFDTDTFIDTSIDAYGLEYRAVGGQTIVETMGFFPDGLSFPLDSCTFYVRTELDLESLIVESDETNNSSEVASFNLCSELGYAADLEILDLSLDDRGTVQVALSNIGALTIDPTLESSTLVYFYFDYDSTDGSFDATSSHAWDYASQVNLGNWSGDFLVAGGQSLVDDSRNLPDGEMTVRVCVDPATAQGETDTLEDNCFVETLLAGTDLVVSDLRVLTDPDNSAQYQVFVDLSNDSDQPVDALEEGYTAVSVNGTEVSAQAWLDLSEADRLFLGARGVQADYTILSGLTLVSGDVVQVCVDSTDTVEERDESNNCSTLTLSGASDGSESSESTTTTTTTTTTTDSSSGGSTSSSSGASSYVANSSFDSGDSEGSTDSTADDVVLASDEVDCTGMSFTDVAIEDDVYESLCALWAMDVVHGKSTAIFAPGELILRDQAAKVFVRLFGYETDPYVETSWVDALVTAFVDVNLSSPLAYYVEKIVSLNLMTGEGTLFRPNEAMSAGEIFEVLSTIQGQDLSATLTEMGYTQESTLTRAEFVQLVYSFVQ